MPNKFTRVMDEELIVKPAKPISLSSLFKSLSLTLAFASTVLSCGILGEKQKVSRTLAMEEEGCLDSLGFRVERFLEGNISAQEWMSTWSCVDDTLESFVVMVKPGSPQGFNVGDLQALARTFLIRRKPVSEQLVRSGLTLKASVLGGSSAHFSPTEIGKLRAIIRLMRDETPAMIPLMRNRKESPTGQNLAPLVDAITQFGVKLARTVDPTGNPTFTREMSRALIGELSQIMDGSNETDLQNWGDFFIEIKNALVNGEPNGIAGDDWKQIIQMGTEFGAVAMGILSAPDSETEFQLAMADRVRRLLDQSFVRWNGAIPYAVLDRVVQSAPYPLLPKRAEEFRKGASCMMQFRFDTAPEGAYCPSYRTCPEGADCSKNPRCPSGGCRPALSRVFGSDRNDALIPQALDTIFGIYRTGMRGRLHMEAIMGGLKQEVIPAEFISLADRYAVGLGDSEKAEVDRLKRIAAEYLGLHPEGSKEFVFTDFSRHSKQNLIYFSWYEAVAEKLLQAYASSVSPLKGNTDDLFFLTKDLELVLLSMSMVHPLKSNIHEKRFREANLFTMPANGDTWMDLKETTNYIATLMSISRLSKRIQKDILADSTPEGRTRPCKPIGEDSCLKIPQYSVQCFRDHFHKNLKEYWRNFPSLSGDFDAMTEQQRQTFLQSYEAASKLSGAFDESDISAYDVDSYAGVPHYAEALMMKFDTRNNQRDGFLDSVEINHQVWPTFQTEFKKLTNLPGIVNFMNKPLFIYLLRYGGLPFKCQNSPQVGEIAKFAGWMAIGGHNASFRIRRERMFKIFEELSKPVLPGCKGYLPPAVCKGSSPTPSPYASGVIRRGIALSDEMIEILENSLSEEEKFFLSW